MVTEIACALEELGVTTTVVSGGAEDRFRSRLDGRVRVVWTPSERAFGLLVPWIRLLQKEEFDVVISSATVPNLIVLLGVALGFSQTPVITRDDFHISTQMRNRGWIKYAIVKVAIRLLYPSAKASVAVSSGVADDLRNIASRRSLEIRCLYNPVYGECIAERSRESVEEAWDPDIPLVVTVARLTKQKDVGTLLRATKIVVTRMNIQVLVIGEGPERPRLQELAGRLGLSHVVRFLGYRKNPMPFIAAADLFALSSAWEGFGNVLVEALALGTPVVSTDCPAGPAEILGNGRWGSLVPVGDHVGFAEAMIQGLKRPTDRSSLVRRAKVFSKEGAVASYARLIKEICETNRQG